MGSRSLSVDFFDVSVECLAKLSGSPWTIFPTPRQSFEDHDVLRSEFEAMDGSEIDVGRVLRFCCLLIGPIYLNLSLPRFGSLFLDPALPGSCAGFPSVLHATCGASYGATSSVGWMDGLPADRDRSPSSLRQYLHSY